MAKKIIRNDVKNITTTFEIKNVRCIILNCNKDSNGIAYVEDGVLYIEFEGKIHFATKHFDIEVRELD